MRRTMLAVAWSIGTAAMAADTTSLLSQGKLDADLGRHEQAAAAFQAVADNTGAPAAERAEALIRLGLVRRQMGDVPAANRAFERVWSEHRTNMEAMRQLVYAVSGVLPSGKYWDASWQGVVLVVDEAGPRLEWPGLAPGRRSYKGEPVTLDVKDGDISDVFRLFADVSGLNVVVFPGVGRGKLVYKAHEVPWDQALHAILAPNGLDYRLNDNVLTIAPPEHLGTARSGPAPPPSKRHTGALIDVDFKDADLRAVLAKLAETGGAAATFDPATSGKVTLKLHQVPWDQAFDLVAKVNGLAWTPQGNVLAVHQHKAGPTNQSPYAPGQLGMATIADVRLRGIVKTGSGYTALFLCPGDNVCFGSIGARLQDAEIKAVDATSVTFRRNDGAESGQSLYPHGSSAGPRRVPKAE